MKIYICEHYMKHRTDSMINIDPNINTFQKQRIFFYLTKYFCEKVNITPFRRKNFSDYFNVCKMLLINTAKAGGTRFSFSQCACVRMRLFSFWISIRSISGITFAVFSGRQGSSCSLKSKMK